MMTIKITVDTQKHASFLTEMLSGISFVKNIEAEIPLEKRSATYQKLKKILDKYANKNLFKEIKDPVKWQKQLRNEWE